VAEHPEARFAGVDPSEVMLVQAAKRNRLAVLEGRCDLRLAAAERLPFPDDTFSAAFTLGTVRFWSSQRAGFDELARVLEDHGVLVIGLKAQTGESAGDGSELPGLLSRLQSAGFDPTAQQRKIGRAAMTFVGATRKTRCQGGINL
jgi:ubiquinone/menaquinone biosynthesis C-methylase UbiE